MYVFGGVAERLKALPWKGSVYASVPQVRILSPPQSRIINRFFMKKVLVFGASNSQTSINKQLAVYAAKQLGDVEITVIDLNDFEMPIFSPEREDVGIPPLAQDFKELIRNSDGIIISFAEHNGSYTAAFKNIYDWVSRIQKNTWLDKPLLLMATSPGSMGGRFVLDAALQRFGHGYQGKIISFSLPSFRENFTDDQITNVDLAKEFSIVVNNFSQSLKNI